MEPCRQLLAAAKVCSVLALAAKKAGGSTPWNELLLMSTRVTLPVWGRKSRVLLERRFAARDSECSFLGWWARQSGGEPLSRLCDTSMDSTAGRLVQIEGGMLPVSEFKDN